VPHCLQHCSTPQASRRPAPNAVPIHAPKPCCRGISNTAGTLSGVIGVAVTGHMLQRAGGAEHTGGWYQAMATSAIQVGGCWGCWILVLGFRVWGRLAARGTLAALLWPASLLHVLSRGQRQAGYAFLGRQPEACWQLCFGFGFTAGWACPHKCRSTPCLLGRRLLLHLVMRLLRAASSSLLLFQQGCTRPH
jgi:hypothetical protein